MVERAGIEARRSKEMIKDSWVAEVALHTTLVVK